MRKQKITRYRLLFYNQTFPSWVGTTGTTKNAAVVTRWSFASRWYLHGHRSRPVRDPARENYTSIDSAGEKEINVSKCLLPNAGAPRNFATSERTVSGLCARILSAGLCRQASRLFRTASMQNRHRTHWESLGDGARSSIAIVSRRVSLTTTRPEIFSIAELSVKLHPSRPDIVSQRLLQSGWHT